MPKYKIHYFNIRARAESCRILLALSGEDWEDIRIERSEVAAKKESGILPFGQMPALEVDGTVVGQSMAILRFLAREHGFLPATSLQIAIADSIVDQIQDCTNKLIQNYHEKDPALKEEKMKDFKENLIPKNMKYLDKIRKDNCQGKAFFFGDKLTYADVHFFDFWNNYVSEGKIVVPDFLKENFPDLTKLYEAVMNEPVILEYLKKRPQT